MLVKSLNSYASNVRSDNRGVFSFKKLGWKEKLFTQTVFNDGFQNIKWNGNAKTLQKQKFENFA